MDIDDVSKAEGDETKEKPILVILDTIGNGKSGTKGQCLKAAATALKDGKSVFIDRCNLDREQRAEFVKLGGTNIDVHSIVLDHCTESGNN
ncbi:hypothetical protein CJ030_MR2G019406 [Morella rubra]|uniref:Uncharacterized protein n=1 Tax=Morella rubra TaxID=262757 RepID=A0A6A1WGJ8_9ROSI|nr:hypothetical protein CJ030_MR2G019406 [Morella rubra]